MANRYRKAAKAAMEKEKGGLSEARVHGYVERGVSSRGPLEVLPKAWVYKGSRVD